MLKRIFNTRGTGRWTFNPASSNPRSTLVDMDSLAEAKARGASMIGAFVRLVKGAAILTFAVAATSLAQAQSLTRTLGAINSGPSYGLLVDGATNYTAVAATGTGVLFAIRDDGTVVAATTLPTRTPYYRLPQNLKAIAIAGGSSFALAVRPDHTVVAWGDNVYDACNVPEGLTDVVSVAAGQYHAVALKADGTVVAWGNDELGQTDVPEGLTGVVKVRAGGYNSYAIRADGTVVAFGGIPVPDGLDHVVDMECGYDHVLALKSDGTVVIFGVADDYGQMTPPQELTNVRAIGAGTYASYAIFNDGTSIGWGYGETGLTTLPPMPYPPTTIVAGYGSGIMFGRDPVLLKLAKPSVYGGSNTTQTGTITLSEATTTNHTFTLNTSSPSDTSVPSTVTVPAGTTQVQFTVGTSLAATNKSVTITATDGTYTRTSSFNVVPPTLASFTTDASAIEGGQAIYGSLTLAATYKSAVTVGLSASGSSVTLPASVTIRAGATTAVFPISLSEVAAKSAVTLTATTLGGSRTAKLTILPRPAIKSFVVASLSPFGNSSTIGTITLKAPAGETGQTVNLTAGPGLIIPASVHFDPGQSVATFDIGTTDVAGTTSTSIGASTTFSTYNRALTVKPMIVSTVALSPASIRSGETATLTVTLAASVTTATTVDITVSVPTVAGTASATLVIPAGSQSGVVTVTGSAVTKTRTTSVRATRHGVTKNTTLTVNP